MRLYCTLFFIVGLFVAAQAQVSPNKFGKGIHVYGQDSSFHLRFGFRFQNLFTSEWTSSDGSLSDPQLNFLVRRSRLKFDGFAYTPKLKYKLEIGLTNRDIGGDDEENFNNASRLILDAYVDWNFYKNWTIRFGQAKLPGNRERVISSANMQFVDRSRLNSRFNIDRDIGIQLKHHSTIGSDFIVKEIFALSKGEGRDVTIPNAGGLDYTFRLELLPFGEFKSKGDYVGSAIVREETPKLNLGITYNINDRSVRERGQLGSFIMDENGNLWGKTMKTLFIDFMYKHQGLAIMSEFVYKSPSGGSPFVSDGANNIVGTLYTGTGFTIASGYMFRDHWEVALRYTALQPDEGVSRDEQSYTLGLSKFVVGHSLKIQTDLGYRNVNGGSNKLIYRLQTDIHF